MTMSMMYSVIMMLPVTLTILNWAISKKALKKHEKMVPFECGFDSMSLNRLPFSIQFFLISMIFLIFDIEITLLIPIISSISTYKTSLLSLSMFFLSILLLGLYFECLEKSIKWKM